MKTARIPALAAFLAVTSLVPAQDLKVNEGIMMMPVERLLHQAPPLFFSSRVEVNVTPGLEAVTEEIKLAVRIHQGKPEVVALGLSRSGEVVSVSGEGLSDWAVRTDAQGNRFLDLRPVLGPDGKGPERLEVTVAAKVAVRDGAPAALLLMAPGNATGFAQTVRIGEAAGIEWRVEQADGMVMLDGGKGFAGDAAAEVVLRVSRSGAVARPVELANARLTGTTAADATSVAFVLEGEVRVSEAGKAVELVSGRAALAGETAGDGWHVRLVKKGDGYAHELVGERTGDFPLRLEIVAPVQRKGDWRMVEFSVPAGVVVPVALEGLDGKVTFEKNRAVVPRLDGAVWKGFLPAAGTASLAWKPAREETAAALAFTSQETAEVRVGAGLLRQASRFDLQVLQGRLDALTLRLEGNGEVLAVKGEQVLGWSVREQAGARVLDVRLSQPLEGSGAVVVEAQAALAAFPVRAAPMRMTPERVVRHSGHVRVANEGAVRLEPAAVKGMMQLAPAQFPGGKLPDGTRQEFVYRFPSAEYSYEVAADQVLPEISVTQVLVHELAETDRIVRASVELDIREAPLREWEVGIPGDFAVASVSGQAVADFAPGSDVKNGVRMLKVVFGQAVTGRQLIEIRLEKNIQAQAGDWPLPRLEFPGTKSVRGHLGVVSTPGYRITAGETVGLSEVAPAYFPSQLEGLQQAFRVRDAAWKAVMKVEALGQSVQADVFHLYSLKEGVAYGSVLVNFFVVGAPASEWKIEVPEGVGNIEVTGQHVRRDWRREGAVLVVPLAKPVLGSGTVLVTFEQPMSARGAELSPGTVKPLGVQSERGHVQVVSPLQVNYEVTRGEGALLKLDALEIPAEYRLLTGAPTLAAWQYTARPFDIGIKVEWYAPGETVAQVVDFMKLASRVSRDGQVVTDARMFVKARGQSLLRVTMPAGSTLWETRVDGKVVNARVDGAETLVELPAKADPNDPAEVVMRYGMAARRTNRPHLEAPATGVPVVISEWSVTGDAGRRLLPAGGTADLVNHPRTENGFEWVAKNKGVFVVVALVLSTILLGRGTPGIGRGIAAGICGLLAGVGCVLAARGALAERRVNVATLEYAAPVVQAGKAVMVEVANVPAWRALLSMPGVLAVVAGLALLGWCLTRRKGAAWRQPSGWILIGCGLLAQAAGAAWFFLLLGIMVLALAWVPALVRCGKGIKARRAAKPAATVAAVLAFACAWGGPGARVDAAPVAGPKPAESILHTWRIGDGRLAGEIAITARAEAGERFLLLRAPAVLTGFEGEGWRVVKVAGEDHQEAYHLVTAAAGVFTGKATFEMPLANPAAGWAVPSGPAAVQRVEVRWKEAGWEFDSPMAARVEPLAGLAAGESGARIVLGPADGITVAARAKQRDTGSEQTKYFVETANLFLPGPGAVNGRHRVLVRPAQGRVAALMMKVPEGFTVGEVSDGPVGSWRFDPATRELRIAVEPAQEGAFAVQIETQRGAGALPMDLQLEPLRVGGASGEVGLLALAFADDAQPENVTAESMPVVNLDDFDASLVPAGADKQPLAVLQRVFRYQSDAGTVSLRVAPVEPEVRMTSMQVVSLGDDRMVLAADLAVAVTRAGVFRLTLEVPKGLEVEALSGPAVSHWTEGTGEKGERLVTLHLNGRTLGEQTIAASLVGPPAGSQPSWQVPRLVLREAARHTGVLTIVPGRGLQVLPVSRRNVSQLDAREAGSMQPGALGFRLLQADWEVALATSELEPWVTARVLHDVTVREGQVLTRVSIGYKVENAAVKRLRVGLPGLDEAAAGTVRATGADLADFVKLDGEQWELVFKSGVAGATAVEIEYQTQRKDTGGQEQLVPVVLSQVRQTSYFCAVRAAGRLQVEAAQVPRGWQAVDWSLVKAAMNGRPAAAVPALAYRVSEPEGALVLGLQRHDLAGGTRLRVTEGELTTLVAPDGAALTAVVLRLEVGEKGTLRLRAPKGGTIYHVFANGESTPLVRDGDDWLFHVYPAGDPGQPAEVRFVYGTGADPATRLEGPSLNLPLENLTWRVVVPEGWELAKHQGDFELKESGVRGRFGVEDYRSFVQSKRQSSAREATQLLEKANAWLQAGQQDKAALAFSKAANGIGLDESSNEDARVQLEKLRKEQAVMGLQARRQKLYLDNRFNQGGGPRNEQLEQAADVNPLLNKGDLNWDPRQADQMLLGNTAEETAALKTIADRIVAQQLAAEPAPAGLELTLPERGTVVTFARSVQVDGGKPLWLDLGLRRQRAGGAAAGLLLAALTAFGFAMPRGARK